MPSYPVALAFNPTPTSPPPEIEAGRLAVGFNSIDYSSQWEGLKWWAPPAKPSDDAFGLPARWIMGTYRNPETQPTPFGNSGGVAFWATLGNCSGEFSRIAEIVLSEVGEQQEFNGDDKAAYVYLESTAALPGGGSVLVWTNFDPELSNLQISPSGDWAQTAAVAQPATATTDSKTFQGIAGVATIYYQCISCDSGIIFYSINGGSPVEVAELELITVGNCDTLSWSCKALDSSGATMTIEIVDSSTTNVISTFTLTVGP